MDDPYAPRDRNGHTQGVVEAKRRVRNRSLEDAMRVRDVGRNTVAWTYFLITACDCETNSSAVRSQLR